MRRMWRLMRKKRATRPLLSHHPMFLSPLSYSMVPMQPVHLCCHLPCHVTYLDWNGQNEERQPSTFTCVVSSALRGCHENLIIEPIYPDIYATIKAFMWLSRRNAALCVLVPSHSDFTSTNRGFAATAGEDFEAMPRQCLPHGLLSVAMHDGETDWMVLGVMLVSQSGISLVRPMPLRCPLGDITSILDGPGWARWASPLPGVHIIRWNACRSCQNILSLYQDIFCKFPRMFQEKGSRGTLDSIINTFSNF